jgi:thiol-disulfide isomerase/thioredoxin
MIKKITTLIFILSTIFVQGQIFSEDFNSGAIPVSFITYDLDGNTVDQQLWQFMPQQTAFSAVNYMNATFAASPSLFTTPATADKWMVMPAITLSNNADAKYLRFDVSSGDIGAMDGVEVYVSLGNTPADFLATTAIYSSTGIGEPYIGTGWATRDIDITAYSGQNIYIAFRNNNYNNLVVGIDNISVIETEFDYDIELTSLDFTQYTTLPSNIDIDGTVTNLGANSINSMNITWTDGVNSYTDNLTGLNILPFSNYSFTHNTQLNIINNGSVSITVIIDSVNSIIDSNTTNNTLTQIVNTVSFIPTKRVVFEEAGGTWCPFCPKGVVAMESLVQNFPNTAIGIAVHNADQMTVTNYDGAMGVTNWPNAHVDRALLNVGGGNVNETSFLQFYSERINVFTPVEINADAHFDSLTRTIDVNITGEFVTNLSGDYRFNAVILEDGVGPFNQANNFGGTSPGLVGPISGINFSTSPNPVSMLFDHVARAILGGFDGTAASLPSNITAGGIYTHNYTHSLPVNQNENNVQVVAMIINNSTGEILNGIKVALTGLPTPNYWDCTNEICVNNGINIGQYISLSDCQTNCLSTGNKEKITQIKIFPNPAKENLTIDGDYLSLDIYDVFGKLILSSHNKKIIDLSSLNNGLYSLSIYTKGSTIKKKISIAK